MFQTSSVINDNIMQITRRHSNVQVQGLPQNVRSLTELSEDCSKGTSDMYTIELHPGSIQNPCTPQPSDHAAIKTNGTTTPRSTRSSLSSESGSSSTSVSDTSKHASFKSNLKSATAKKRKSSPSIVRFAAEPEPFSKDKAKIMLQLYEEQHGPRGERDGYPNPLLKYQHRHSLTVPTSLSQRHSLNTLGQPKQQPRSVSNPLVASIKMRSIQRSSAPVPPVRPDTRWSAIPLPEGFSPPRPGSGSRVASYQSGNSSLSVQSAPASLMNVQGLPIQYNPMEHYIPCLEPNCRAHYTPAHSGPTYYFPQGPYSLPRHHGYCLRHAAKEHKEASAICKREYEISRQNCGRKTLPQIAHEFDLFLQHFREERRLEDAEMQQQQRAIVLGGPAPVSSALHSKIIKEANWDWRYTPRPCTKALCKNAHFSPFANHLYSFYTTLRPSKFLPVHTFCPCCAKTEIEAFERLIQDKWTSRSDWDEVEWNEWFDNAGKDRTMDIDFQEKEQERIVNAKGPAYSTLKVKAEKKAKVEVQVAATKSKGKRMSLFKKIFAITV